jgi:hypothetical protein
LASPRFPVPWPTPDPRWYAKQVGSHPAPTRKDGFDVIQQKLVRDRTLPSADLTPVLKRVTITFRLRDAPFLFDPGNCPFRQGSLCIVRETKGSGEVSQQKKTKATENRESDAWLDELPRMQPACRLELESEKTLRYLCYLLLNAFPSFCYLSYFCRLPYCSGRTSSRAS